MITGTTLSRLASVLQYDIQIIVAIATVTPSPSSNVQTVWDVFVTLCMYTYLIEIHSRLDQREKDELVWGQ